jgi:hypothetical protein
MSEFALLVENELSAYVVPNDGTESEDDEPIIEVVPDEEQQAEFEDIYCFDLKIHPPTVPLTGRTILTCSDSDFTSDLAVRLIPAAISTFFPGHTNVKMVSDVKFRYYCKFRLFQAKDTDGTDVLFAFDDRDMGGFNPYSRISLVGPLNISSLDSALADHLRMIEYGSLIEICNEFNRLHTERTRELERRANLMVSAAMSLLTDSDEKGLGSIGVDNLELVAKMLMRM